MNIDVHAHYVPTDSLAMAAQIGARHGLEAQNSDRGQAIPLRDGKPFLTQAKAEFSDLDLRLSIMEQQGVDMQVLSPAGSYFFYWCQRPMHLNMPAGSMIAWAMRRPNFRGASWRWPLSRCKILRALPPNWSES